MNIPQVTVLLTAKKTRTAHQESTATTLRRAWVTVFQVRQREKIS